MDNLRGVDLNLLVVLDALLGEAHVSRAAARLGLSQPAASAALDRLRHLFGDPLLLRGRGGMRLTPAAQALRPRLHAALASVRAVLDAPAPDLLVLRQDVRLVMADAPAALVVAALVPRLARTAPGLRPVLLPWRGAADAAERLERGEADLAASVLPPLGPAFRQEALGWQHYVVAMRPGHPAAGGGLEAWLAYGHVVVSGQGEAATLVDAALRARGLSRRVAAVVPSFLMVPPLLHGSDLLALVPAGCLPRDAPLHAMPPPLPVDGFRLGLAWHARRDGDPAVRHVAAEIRAVLDGAAPAEDCATHER